jgi:hypothetical protein
MTIDLPPDWLGCNDREALTRALEQCRAASKEECRQIDGMVQERGWMEAAAFASYSRQIDTLHLRPWQEPPSHVSDAFEPRRGEEAAARILRKMLKAGVSRWHPDPLAALEAAGKDGTS